MKWVLLALELLMLFFVNNTLFLVPEPYDRFTAIAASTGIVLAAVFAWLSGKRFAISSTADASWKKLAATPPVVIWIFVVVLFSSVGLMKILAYR